MVVIFGICNEWPDCSCPERLVGASPLFLRIERAHEMRDPWVDLSMETADLYHP